MVIILTQYITGFFLFLALWLASYFYPIFTVKQLLSRGVDYNDQFPTIQQNRNKQSSVKNNNSPDGIRTADSSPSHMKTTEGFPQATYNNNDDNQWSTSRPLSPRADPLSPRSHRSGAADAYNSEHNLPITSSSKVKGSSGKGGGGGGYKNKAHAIKRSMIVPSSDELPV